MQHPYPSLYATPQKSTGELATVRAGGLVNLTAGTWYVPLGGVEGSLTSVHVSWDATAAFTSMIPADCNHAPADVTLISEVPGKWIPENPPTGAYVPVDGANASSSGASVANTTGAAGGAMFHLGNLGSKRGRLKVVVTVAGDFVFSPHGKL